MIVTISRLTGSFGDEIAEQLSQQLNIALITRNKVLSDWLPGISTKHDLNMLQESPKHYNNISKESISFAEYIEQRLKEEAGIRPLIILGLGSQIIFKDTKNAIKVRITASEDIRKSRIQGAYGLNDSEAEQLIELKDRWHKKYLKTIYDIDCEDLSLYDICLNTDNLSVNECCNILKSFFEIRLKTNDDNIADINSNSHIKSKSSMTAFMHPAEEEFAKILEMYNIEWEYEPKTFPTEWDEKGNVIKAITPDFYLPRFNTYIEITTMDQKYVAEKKRKVRRIKELYPEININIVFKRDFHSLLKRFGLVKGAGNN